MAPRHALRSLALLLPLAMAASTPERPQAAPEPVYMVYYWKVRPGHEAEYAAYVRDVAEKIDAEAQKAGVFETVTTFTPAIQTGAASADWTYMRVFKLASWASLDAFSAGLDAAGRRLYPTPGSQPSSAGMRDLVRQEIWREFR